MQCISDYIFGSVFAGYFYFFLKILDAMCKCGVLHAVNEYVKRKKCSVIKNYESAFAIRKSFRTFAIRKSFRI